MTPTVALELSVAEIQLVSALLANCNVHSQHAEMLVGLKHRVAAAAEAKIAELSAQAAPAEGAAAQAKPNRQERRTRKAVQRKAVQ